jgi:hypothetical protein
MIVQVGTHFHTLKRVLMADANCKTAGLTEAGMMCRCAEL